MTKGRLLYSMFLKIYTFCLPIQIHSLLPSPSPQSSHGSATAPNTAALACSFWWTPGVMVINIFFSSFVFFWGSWLWSNEARIHHFLALTCGLASLFAACGSCAAVACLEAAALHCLSLGLHLPKFSYFLFAFIYLSDCGCMRKMRNSVDWNFSVSTFFFFVPVMNFII